MACIGDNPELAAHVIRMFLNTCSEHLTDIRKAIRARDNPALTLTAHSLKGMALNVGAAAASDTAGALELLGRGRLQTEDLDRAEALFARLKEDIRQLIPVLRDEIEG